MEFRVLGPLEVGGGSGPLAIGPRKQRALLARLLLDAGRTVSVERLLEDLWGEELPESAPKMIQIYVSGLRKVLPEGALQTRPPGYALHVAPGASDLERFERLTLEGRAALEGADPARAARLLREAADLWRGPALAEFTEPFAATERDRLEEVRLACVEARIEADLALGRHAAVVAELEALIARHPLRENLRAQLMRALYAAGRQVEALTVYQEFRRRLDEELGIGPSPGLRALEQAILVQDATLTLPPLGSGVAPAAVQAGAAQPPPPSSLPGRAPELARLRAAFARALQGERRVVVITGERGSGKTSLVDTFLAELRPGTLVGRAACRRRQGPGEPYGPVLDVLGALGAAAGGDVVRGALTERAPSWYAHLPWLAAGPGEVHGVTAERMVREMVEALQVMAAALPLVLVFEDIEWSDPSTRALLDALASRREPGRLLLVLDLTSFVQTDDPEPVGRMVRELCLRGPGELIVLRNLSHEAVAEHLAAAFPRRAVPDGLVEALWTRASGGQPLLLRHLLDHWLADGRVVDEGDRLRVAADLDGLTAGVPPGLRDMLGDRLAQCTPEEADVVRAAVVVGPAFTVAGVAAILGEPEAAVRQRCVSLAATGIFVADDDRRTRWRFLHALVHEGLYAGLDGADRAALHRRAGDWLADAGGAPAADVARHLLAGHDADRAVRFLRQAADDAFARRAYPEGIGHARTAVELLDDLPEGPDRMRLEVDLRSRLGQALVATGGWSAEEAETMLERARVVASRLGDKELLVSVLLTLATLREVRGEPERAQRLAEEGLERGNSAARRRIDAQELLACSHLHQGGFGRALQYAETGTALFGDGDAMAGGHYDNFPATLGDNAGVACHSWAALATWFLGEPDRALQRAEHAVQLARDETRAYALAPALAQLAVVRQLRREAAETLEAAQATIDIASERGYAYRVAMGRVLRGWAIAALGSPHDGVTEIICGVAAARATGARMEDPYFLALLADASLEAIDVDSGLSAVEEGLEVSRREHAAFCDAELHRLRAGLARAGGSPVEAVRAELEIARAIARRQQARVLELRAVVDLASLHREEGDQVGARRLIADVLEQFHEGFETPDLVEARAIVRATV